MNVSADRADDALPVGIPTRRRLDEFMLILLVGILGAGGYALTLLAERTELTGTLAPRLAVVLALLVVAQNADEQDEHCLLYTSPSPRDISGSRMPSSA